MPLPVSGHVFISYSRRDDETMRKIAFFLRDHGFKVWVDNEKLIPGTAAWEESIENAIKNAFVVIVILSPDSKNSEWVRREITYSDQFQKRVFPALAKGSEEMSLPLRLVTRQYVDLRKDENDGLNSLLAAIKFYVEEKETLEMKRPTAKQNAAKVASSPHADLPAASYQKAKSPSRWILPTGIFMLVCVLGIGTVWVGYRLFSPSTPATIPNTANPTFTATPSPEIIIYIPTSTPIPTSPNASISDVPSQFLNDVQVLFTDSFDDPNTGLWDIYSGSIDNGVLQIIGNSNYDGAFRNKELRSGEGIVIDFVYSQNSILEIFLEHGDFGADAYKRFGFSLEENDVSVNVYGSGNTNGNGFSGNLTLEPETNYSVLTAILPNAEFLQVIWDPTDPSSFLSYREEMDQSWLDLTWIYFVQAGAGTIQLDNYMEIQFSGVR